VPVGPCANTRHEQLFKNNAILRAGHEKAVEVASAMDRDFQALARSVCKRFAVRSLNMTLLPAAKRHPGIAVPDFEDLLNRMAVARDMGSRGRPRDLSLVRVPVLPDSTDAPSCLFTPLLDTSVAID
jgi:hypothetical protein